MQDAFVMRIELSLFRLAYLWPVFYEMNDSSYDWDLAKLDCYTLSKILFFELEFTTLFDFR